MGTKYLIDTNIIIHFLSGMLEESGSNWVENLLNKEQINISVINQIEVLGFNGADEEMKIIEAFIGILPIIPLTENIVLQTIRLRKEYKIKLPDAIIAATALQHNLNVVTQNVKDFRNIPNLKVINPHEK